MYEFWVIQTRNTFNKSQGQMNELGDGSLLQLSLQMDSLLLTSSDLHVNKHGSFIG